MKVLNTHKVKLSVHETPTKSSQVVIQAESHQRKRRTDQVKEFSCNCGKAYYSRSGLYIHINIKHKGITPVKVKTSRVALNTPPSESFNEVRP